MPENNKNNNTIINEIFDNKQYNQNKIINIFLNILKVFIALIFSPLFLIFLLFQSSIFLKIFKQVVAIVYFMLFIVFIYTLFNLNRKIGNDEKVISNLEFKEKIRNFD